MLTLLVRAPDMDQLRQLISDLPALEAAAAERPGCAVVLVEDDRITVPSGDGGG